MWRRLGPDADVQAFAIDPNNPSVLYAGSQRVYRSGERGKMWQQLDAINDVTVLLAAPTQPTTLYAGGLHLYRSRDEGQTWQAMVTPSVSGPWSEGNFAQLAVDAHDPGTVYALSWAGLQRTRDGGEHWQYINIRAAVTPTFSSEAVPFSVVAAPTEAGVLYVAIDDTLIKSGDYSKSWHTIFVHADAEGLPAGAFDTHPTHAQELFVNGDAGYYHSNDGGATWTLVRVDIPRYVGDWNQRVSLPLFGPKGPQQQYVVVTRSRPSYDVPELFGTVYHSSDGGVSWSPLGSSLPGTRINGPVLDPAEPNALYVPTSDGVWAWRP